MGDKVRAKAAMARAGVPLVPGTEGATTLDEARDAADGGRLPGPAEGRGGRRRQGHAARPGARRARDGLRDRVGRGRGGLRRRQPLPREGGRPGAARRDPGAGRRAGRRAHARRARVLDPAPPPEADRGVALAGARRRDARGDGGRRRARVPRDRLPQRRHVRVPARAGRRVLLHRAERAPPGRAPGDGARDRDRPRARAAADRGRRAARAHRPRRRAAGTRSRCGSTPRTRRATSRRRRAGSTRFRPPLGPGVRLDTTSRTAPSSRRTTTRCSAS